MLTLLRAITNGVFLCLRRFIDSIVCGSNPCMISTTKIAMSHKDDPLDLRLLKYKIAMSHNDDPLDLRLLKYKMAMSHNDDPLDLRLLKYKMACHTQQQISLLHINKH